MSEPPKSAREIVMRMLIKPVTLSGIASVQDATQTKANLLKHWKKVQKEFAEIDGQPDAETTQLTVGVRATNCPSIYIFELRPKRTSGAVRPRSYQLIESYGAKND